jgi:hypothetical protein
MINQGQFGQMTDAEISELLDDLEPIQKAYDHISISACCPFSSVHSTCLMRCSSGDIES